MDKRKLQRTGGASHTVTLPKHWIEARRLSLKNEVWMYAQASGTLLLKNAPAPNPAPTVLAISAKSPETITREATALYIAGINEIEFYDPKLTQAQRTHIRNLIQRFIGFEIIDEASEKIIVRNILDIAKLPISDVIDKMFLVARSMLHDAIESVIKNNPALSQDLADRDFEIDKLYLIINRQFHSMLEDRVTEEDLGITRSSLNYHRTVALQLERIADHAVKIAETSQPKHTPLGGAMEKSYRPVISQLFALIERVQSMTETVNEQQAHRILNENSGLEKNIIRLRTAPKKETPLYIILEDSLDRVRGYLMNIAEATIDHAIQKTIR